MTHYMFRTVFPSIVRSSRLYILHYLFDICLLLYVQSVHTDCTDCTYSCQTDTAVCLLGSSQQYLFDICLLLYVQP